MRVHSVPAAVLLVLVMPLHATAAADAVSRKDVRTARAAVREGRLAEALDAYEKILQSAPTDEQRFEALSNTLLILLASEPEAAKSELVRERLRTSTELARAGDFEHELEIRALDAQRKALDSLEADIDWLEARREEELAESAAAKKASEEQRLAVEATLAEQLDLARVERRDKLVLQQRIEQLEGHLATREAELEARVEELGRCASEMRFVVDQLEGTQESELQMLQVVMRKNEDLAKTRVELRKRERQLANQAEQLALKEAEIHKREKAIREVTERVLGKEAPDPGAAGR